MTFYNIADTIIYVEGSKPFLNALDREFLLHKCANSNEIHIKLIEKKNKLQENCNIKDNCGPNISVGENFIMSRRDGFQFKYEVDKNIKIFIFLFTRLSFFKKIRNIISNYKKGEFNNEMAKWGRFISYSGLWPLLHFSFLNLPEKKSFIHSCALESDNKGILLTGSGGAGKSTLCSYLQAKYCYKYLSEDFSIVSEEGYAYLSPRRVAFYYSDFKKSPDLIKDNFRNYLKSNSIDHLLWKFEILQKKNPIRRLNPELIYSKNVQVNKIKIKKIFYLKRNVAQELQITSIDKTELAKRAIHSSMRELRSFYEEHHQAMGNAGNSLINMDTISESMVKVYYSAFSEADCYLLSIPNNYPPSKASKEIHKLVSC